MKIKNEWKKILVSSLGATLSVAMLSIGVFVPSASAIASFPTVAVVNGPGTITNPQAARTIEVGTGSQLPDGISNDGNQVWVGNLVSGDIYSYNPATGAVVNTITATSINGVTVPGGTGVVNVSDLASDGTHLWVDEFNQGTVGEFTLSGPTETPTYVRTIAVGVGSSSQPKGISDDGTHVWVTDSYQGTTGGSVTEILESTGAVVQTITTCSHPEEVSSDGTDVWVACFGSPTVDEISASTGAVIKAITLASLPYYIFSDGTDVWVSTPEVSSMTEIAASTGTIVGSPIALAAPPQNLTSDGTDVWVGLNTNIVDEIPISTLSVLHTVAVPAGSTVAGISASGTQVWVADSGSNYITEISSQPQISPTSLPNTATTSTYNQTLVASAGQAPYTWSISSGTLPPGLSLNTSTGAITGTPTTPGSYTFTAKVTDSSTLTNT
jgi:hypothetical protein